MFHSQFFGSAQPAAATGFYPKTIANSVRLDGTSHFKSNGAWTTSAATRTFTFSMWVKRADVGSASTTYMLAGFQNSSNSANTGLCLRDDVITYFYNSSAHTSYGGPRLLRDYGGWYHLVFKGRNDYYGEIFVNGVSLGTSAYAVFEIMNGSVITIGTATNLGSTFAGGYLADVYFINNQSLDPTAFAEEKNGVWVPKAYTGTYGTDSFHLDFADSADLGKDVSGNGNDLVPTNIAASDQMLDTPTNNFAVLNPLDTATTGALSNGNLVTSGSAKVTMRPTSGKWYYEKDGVGVSYDADTNGEFNPTLTAGTYNFGQSTWSDTGPTGSQKALCTANLPEPAISPNIAENSSGTTSEENFNPVIWTGDGVSGREISSVGFQPDLVWIKARNVTYSHAIFDSLRGAGVSLRSNGKEADVTNQSDGYQSSFTSSGFVLTAGSANIARVNGSGTSYVAWDWKADNTSGSTNTDGTITSTVSVNQDAGFSIVSYTGTGSNATVGHGLGVAPAVVIVKKRTGTAANWPAYHKEANASPASGTVYLDSTNAFGVSSTLWNNTEPTSSVFSVGTANPTNLSTEDYIAYCFSEVEGFSKFGSYTGNGSTDGPFIYTGFKPAFVIVKRTDTTANWIMMDNTRDSHNVADAVLYPNRSNAEATADETDFLSNGFKLRHTDADGNASGGTYLYMAFAENPFKYATAR